jgi:hypothetical protein
MTEPELKTGEEMTERKSFDINQFRAVFDGKLPQLGNLFEVVFDAAPGLALLARKVVVTRHPDGSPIMLRVHFLEQGEDRETYEELGRAFFDDEAKHRVRLITYTRTGEVISSERFEVKPGCREETYDWSADQGILEHVMEFWTAD